MYGAVPKDLGLGMVKAHAHRTKAKISFFVCRLFFDIFCFHSVLISLQNIFSTYSLFISIDCWTLEDEDGDKHTYCAYVDKDIWKTQQQLQDEVCDASNFDQNLHQQMYAKLIKRKKQEKLRSFC